MRIPSLLFLLVVSGCWAGSAGTQLAAQTDGDATPEEPMSRPMNHLRNETSPYLLQHRFNPVDWYPWGPEALQKAKDDGKPIFLSVGYSACHWCHVMEHESFEDAEIAAVLNEKFVCIKVDREERPDLDEIYMAAVQAMTRRGGWPMSVFMTPDLKPFFGGTYWPKTGKRGQPGFDRVLAYVDDLWTNQREKVVEVSSALAEDLQRELAPKIEPDEPTFANLDKLVEQSAGHYDTTHFGFGQAPQFAPKFPHASELTALLRAHQRTGEARPLEMATSTLRAMSRGGIYDQVGFGFHRYSTDRTWLVPHFEKMLYDNALLVPVYLEAHTLTGEEGFAQTARETLDYLLAEMRDPDALGFWSATDADSEGEEGKFFVWTQAEIEAVCGAKDGALVCALFGVTEAGNFVEHGAELSGQNVLHVAQSLEAAAASVELSVDDAQASLTRARAALYKARQARVPPLTDDKILTAWCSMAIRACAQGYRVLGDPRYLAAAQSAAEFLTTKMRSPDQGRLLRSWRQGRAQLPAYLEDHAWLALALVELFEADFDPRWLTESKRLLAEIETHFRDPADGNFFFTADDHETLIARTKSVGESSTPSSIAIAVEAFLRVSTLLGDEPMFDVGYGALRANHAWLASNPSWCSTLVLAAEFALSDPQEVIIVADTVEDAAALLRVVRMSPSRNVVTALVHPGNRESLEAIAGSIIRGKTTQDGKAAAYVCRRGVCERPVTDPEDLAAALR